MSLLTGWRNPCKGMAENVLCLKVRREHKRLSSQIPQTKQDTSHLKAVSRRTEEHDQHLDTDPKIDTGASSLISATCDFSTFPCHCINWGLDVYIPCKMKELDASKWMSYAAKWDPQAAGPWSWGDSHARASHQGNAEDRDACSPQECLGPGAFTHCVT